MSTYFLETPRLGFRTWTPEDRVLAIDLWGNPDVARHIRSGPPPPDEDITARLMAEMRCQAEHGYQYWPIFRLTDGAHAGCCGLRPYNLAEGILELGVHLLPAFWRQGLAVEAANATIAYAFGPLGAKGLFAGHNPANDASRGMLAKLGFRYTHDELFPATGLLHPSYRIDPPPATVLRAFRPDVEAAEVIGWLASVGDVEFWNGRIPDLALTPDVFRSWHSDPDVVPLVLEAGGKAVAYGELWLDHEDPSVELAHLLVDPGRRGQGFGKAVTLALVAEARSRAADYPILLRVVPENQRAIACYRGCGFEILPADRQASLNEGERRAYVWMAL